MATIYIKQRQQYFERDGSPLAFGRVTFYDNDTDTPKDIYMSPTESPSNLATNPHRLDAGGFVRDGGIWLGQGTYKAKIERFIGLDPNGSPVFEEYYWEPDIAGAGAESSDILTEVTIDSAITLRTFEAGAYDTVYCLGHTTATDTGGGMFKWDSTSILDDDNGSVFSPVGDPSSGRYLRVFNDSKLLPSQFGAFANDDTLTLSGNFGNMNTYAGLHPETSHIYIPSGDYYINGSMTFSGNITVEMEDGVYFKNNLAGNAVVRIDCSDCIIHSTSQMVDAYAVSGPTSTIYYDPINRDRKAIPDWWGVLPNVTATNEYTAMFEGIQSPRVIHYLNGEYPTTGLDVDFSGYDLEFSNNSSIKLSGRRYTFDGVRRNQSAPCLSWDQSVAIPIELNFLGDTAEMDFFDVGAPTVDADTYQNLGRILTLNGPFNLVWEETDYTFTGTFTQERSLLNHTINGGTLTFNTLTPFGRIITCKTGSLDPNSSNQPLLHNGEINIDWFGAGANVTGTSSANNHLAIVKALETAGVSGTLAKFNSNYVTGNGTYYIHEAIDFTVVDSTDFVNLKGFGIWVDAGTTPVVKSTKNYTVYLEATDIGLYNMAYRETGADTNAFLCTSDNLNVHECDVALSNDNWGITHDGGSGVTNIKNNTFDASQNGYRALDITNNVVNCNNNSFGSLHSSDTATASNLGVLISAVFIAFNNNGFFDVATAPSPYRTGYVLLSLTGSASTGTLSVIGNNFYRTGLDVQGTAQGNITGNSFRETTIEINQVNKTITGNTFVQTSTNGCFLEMNGAGSADFNLATVQNNIYHSESLPVSPSAYWIVNGGQLGLYSIKKTPTGDDLDSWDSGYLDPYGNTRI
jgi:hypothetical protein